MTLTVVTKLQPIKNWTKTKKAEIVALILSKEITKEAVMRYYSDLTAEELWEWEHHYLHHKSDGLRITYVQKYRGRQRKSSQKKAA